MDEASASDRTASIPVGVVLRRAPGVTRWAKWSWKATALLPGAPPGHWRELRRDGDAIEYHAATIDLRLHRTDTEAYLTSLNGSPPCIYVVLRTPEGEPDGRPELLTVTASAYEAQDYTDNDVDIVEPVPIPPGLAAWIADFVRRHHKDEVFVKRKRRPHQDERTSEGIGDQRIRQAGDVYRSPGSIRTDNT